MNALPRVRRHTDGRVATRLPDADIRARYTWSCWSLGPVAAEHMLLMDSDVTGDGWTELFVAELPEPDDHMRTSSDTTVDQWEIGLTTFCQVRGTVTAWDQGLDIEGDLLEDWNVERIERDVLKLLAAITTHRRYAAGTAR